MRSQCAKCLAVIVAVMLACVGVLVNTGSVSADPGSGWAGKVLVDVGGSFVSGHGADNATLVMPDDGSYGDNCYNSVFAGTRAAAERQGMEFVPASCAGATPEDMYLKAQESKRGIQLANPHLGRADAVVMQVRGNPYLTELISCYQLGDCVSSFDPSNPSKYDLVLRDLLGVQAEQEQAVYDALNGINSHALKFSLGFPQMGPKPEVGPGPCWWFLTQAEVESMDYLVGELNRSIREVAERNHAIFVDMQQSAPWAEARHDMCAGDQAWIWGQRPVPPYDFTGLPGSLLASLNSSFHPNKAGQRAIGVALESAMRANAQ